MSVATPSAYVYRKARKISQKKAKKEEKVLLEEERKERHKRLRRYETEFLEFPMVRRGIENIKFSHFKNPEKTIFSVLEINLLKIGSVFSVIFIYEDETIEIVIYNFFAMQCDLSKSEKLWLKIIDSPLKIDILTLLNPKEVNVDEEAIDNAYVISFDSEVDAKQLLSDYFDWVSKNSALSM